MTSKARNLTDPRYSKLAVGVCPDQWGVWFPQDEKQIEPRQAMKEMAEAGFEMAPTATSRLTRRNSPGGVTNSVSKL